jgi:hypothetical protein
MMASHEHDSERLWEVVTSETRAMNSSTLSRVITVATSWHLEAVHAHL